MAHWQSKNVSQKLYLDGAKSPFHRQRDPEASLGGCEESTENGGWLMECGLIARCTQGFQTNWARCCAAKVLPCEKFSISVVIGHLWKAQLGNLDSDLIQKMLQPKVSCFTNPFKGKLKLKAFRQKKEVPHFFTHPSELFSEASRSKNFNSRHNLNFSKGKVGALTRKKPRLTWIFTV